MHESHAVSKPRVDGRCPWCCPWSSQIHDSNLDDAWTRALLRAHADRTGDVVQLELMLHEACHLVLEPDWMQGPKRMPSLAVVAKSYGLPGAWLLALPTSVVRELHCLAVVADI